MKQERTQHFGHYGMCITLHHITVAPADRANLRRLRLSENRCADHEINDLVIELYDRMQARDSLCEVLVSISKPLLREQADMFNQQRINVVRVVSTAAGLPFKAVNGLASVGAGASVGAFANERLRTYHQGDVIITAQASVSGGIGPQRSSLSLLIKSRECQA